MHRTAVIVIAIATAAGAAAAEPAPIVYRGQSQSSAEPRQVAELGNGLLGGDDNAYGYGAQRERRGAVIDLRRAGGTAPVQDPPTQDAGEQGAQPWLERERVGPPYQANGRWYVPTPEPGYSQVGQASWYGPTFHGQRAANGDTFDQEALTAAHPTLPLNSLVQVTNLENGREAIVRVIDRGPFVGERLIDLSHGAALVLGFEQAGEARVNVRYLGPAPRRVAAVGVAEAAAPVAARAQQPSGPVSLLPPPANAAPTGGLLLQVGAFADQENAQRVRAAVEAAGPVSVDVRRTASGTDLYRVRVGPFASPEEAASAQIVLSRLGYGEAVLAAR